MCLDPQYLWRDTYGKCHFEKPGDVLLQGVEHIVAPCGKCIECLEKYSSEWAFRCMLEASQYENNCHLTLTYSDAPKSVQRRDLQLFIKRLRKAISPLKIRYFGCGEYGSKKLRPHYHLVVFGWYPEDAYFWKKSPSGIDLFRSPFLEKIWTLGFSTVAYVDFNACKYTAKYLQKLQPVSSDMTPPFTCMSTRPGIASNFVSFDDLETGKLYVDGRYISLPRFWLKKLEQQGFDLTEYKERKLAQMSLYQRNLVSEAQKKKKSLQKLFTKFNN